MIRYISSLLAAFVLLVMAGSAHATLIGTEVDITSTHGSCLDVTVGGGVECSIFEPPTETDDVIRVDIFDSSIVFEFENLTGTGFLWTASPSTFDIVIDSLTWVDDPAAEILDITTEFEDFGHTGITGSANATITGANQITLAFAVFTIPAFGGCGVEVCGSLTVDILAAHSIPEPASFGLFAIGLAGLGVMTRRRKKRFETA